MGALLTQIFPCKHNFKYAASLSDRVVGHLGHHLNYIGKEIKDK